MKSKQTLGLLLLAAGSAVDSTSGFLTRLTASNGFTTASARGFLAFVFLFAVLMIRDRGRIGPALRSLGLWGMVFALNSSTGMVLNVLSLKLTTAANFFMIFATAPFVAALMGWVVLREKLDLATMLAALAGFAGIAVMVSGGLSGVNLGDLLAILVTCAYGVNVVIMRRAGQMDVLALVTVTVLVSGFLALPLSQFGGLARGDWAVLTALGFVQLGLGNLLIFAAVRRISAAQAGMLGIMGAVFAPIWVLIVLHEMPAPRTLAGGALILGAAVAHLIWTATRPTAAAVMPVQQ